MKHIVLFGAGKSATVLIDYLKKMAAEEVCKVTVADSNLQSVQFKLGENSKAEAAAVNIENKRQRQALVKRADIVISLMPPTLHYLLALDCVEFGRHLLTASYISDDIKKLQPEIEKKGLLFLYEMGLDPGIDHMSAMQIIQRIHAKGGNITSFISHCGGLVAPESDDNPWHYKISWNPRNIILAGKAGAVFKENGKEIHEPYENLFSPKRRVDVPGLGKFCYYPNRDSLGYASIYQLENAATFLRTTIRHPLFCLGWKNIIELKLTDEEKIYDTNGLTVSGFFKVHLEKQGFSKWLSDMLMSRITYAKEMLEKLTQLIDAEEAEASSGEDSGDSFMMVDETGELTAYELETVKEQAAESVAQKMNEANTSVQQLFFLGLEDDETYINQGLCSAADVLQFVLEKKMALQPGDKDMIVMQHEITYTINQVQKQVSSSLIVKGDDHLFTAMAKTVGLPLGIAAKLLIEGKITETGLHIPVIPSIYEPVLKELQMHGISFMEITKRVP